MSPSPIGRSCAAVLVALAMTTRSAAQTARGQEFATRTDIVLADVTVVDGKGQPVVDLGTADFVLTVNGRPRPIQAAEYVPSLRPARSASADSPRDTDADGRLLLIVADEAHLSFGAGRAVMRAAESLLDRLAPEDRVAVLRLPTGGGIEFTRDHARAIQGLRGVSGRSTGRSRLVATVYPSEAAELEEGGGPGWDAAVARECGTSLPRGTACVDAMDSEARSMLNEIRAATRTTLTSLELLLKGLQSAATPINMVLVSEGLFADRNTSSLSELASLAASARVSLNIVRPAANWYDASSSGISSNRSADDALVRGGLERLAGELRGGYYTAVGDGSGAFDRIGAELAGYYLLAFEPTDEDRTGRERRIKVEVKRRGVTIRARSTFAIPAPARTTERTVETAAAPAAPRDLDSGPPPVPPPSANALPMNLTTYALMSPTDGKVRVLVAAEAGESVSAASNWRVSLLLKDARGATVSNSAASVTLSPVRSSVPSPALFSTEVLLDPGDYGFTLALVRGDGGVAMTERKLSAQLRSGTSGLKISDLIVVSEPQGNGAIRVTPTALVDRERAAVFLEVQHADAAALSQSRVTFEVAQSAEGAALVSAQPTFENRANGTQRAYSAVVPVTALPPGDYVMRGVVTAADGARNLASRPFRVDRSRPSASSTDAANRVAAPPLLRASAAVPRFAAARLLAPDVVRTFLDELQQRHPAPSAAMTAFRSGLAELDANRPAQASALFRQTLRAAPDFVGVAYFLGVCHAAAGQDREAIGAWQMAMLSKGAAYIYPPIVDALLRVGDNAKALEFLREAPAAWPQTSERARREAIARAATGDDEGALPLLKPLVDGSKDADLLFVGIQVMYRLYVTRGLNAAERTTFGNWTRQYESLGSADAALVRTWREHVGR